MLANSLFLIGVLAAYNSLQSFVPGMNVTARIYANAKEQVTPLAARLMGTWTLTSAMIRIYASYHIHDQAAYELAFGSFIMAFLSFFSEVFIYKTAPITSPGVWPAFLISSFHIIWMLLSYDSYVQINI